MTVFAINGQIGATGLYLLFAWLLSGAIAAVVANRKGYGERVGLTFGLLLSVVGLLIVLLILPGRPGSAWKREGPLPPRWRSRLLRRGRGGLGGPVGAGGPGGAGGAGGPGGADGAGGPGGADGAGGPGGAGGAGAPGGAGGAGGTGGAGAPGGAGGAGGGSGGG